MLGTKGFDEPTKKIERIEVKDRPTDTEYEVGEQVELAGGSIEVHYEGGETEIVEMTDPRVKIKDGNPANAENHRVTLEFEGYQTSFDITVTDPVISLNVKKSMNTIEYTHGQNINFDGLELEAVKKSGAKIPLTYQQVLISERIASVQSPTFKQTQYNEKPLEVKGTQTITFTYEGKEATQTIIVNDTIKNITLTKQPTKTQYKYEEELELKGATVEIELESGATTTINLPDGSVQVEGYHSNTVGTQQELTVKVGEKIAKEKIVVEVYDYVVSSTLNEPAK